MSTVQVGNEFEDKVFRLVSILVKEGKFIVPPNSKIFQKKKYYSTDRNGYIIFDIAVESYLPEKNEPSLIIFIECKKYKGTVPISDLEEFQNKVKQIAPNANKSILVTNSSVSKSGLNYAKNHHIALARIFNEDKITWLLPREVPEPITYKDVESSEEEILHALCENEYKIINNSIVYFNGAPIYDSIGFLESLYNNGVYEKHNKNEKILEQLYKKNEPLPVIPFLSDSQLNNIANNFRQKLSDKYKINEPKIDTNFFIDYLKDFHDFSVEYTDDLHLTQPTRYLAYEDYENKKIIILNSLLKSENRFRFTLVHEISHLLLHKEIQQLLLCNNSLLFLPEDVKSRIELQANKLTACILLPSEQFLAELNYLIQKYELNNNRGYYIYLDSQPCNFHQWNCISSHLSKVFGVSKEVIKIKLQELGFLKISK